MKTLPNKKPNGPAIWMFLAAILILVYIGTMIVLFLSHLKIVYEPPLLLPIMNTIFAALIPIAVSIIAASVIARNEAISSCHEIASVAENTLLTHRPDVLSGMTGDKKGVPMSRTIGEAS